MYKIDSLYISTYYMHCALKFSTVLKSDKNPQSSYYKIHLLLRIITMSKMT